MWMANTAHKTTKEKEERNESKTWLRLIWTILLCVGRTTCACIFGGTIYSRKWTGVFCSICVCTYCAVEHVCAFYLSSMLRHNRNEWMSFEQPKSKKKTIFVVFENFFYYRCFTFIAVAILQFQPAHELPSHIFFFAVKVFTIFSVSPVVADKVYVYLRRRQGIKRKKKMNGCLCTYFRYFPLVCVSLSAPPCVVSLYFRLSAGDGSDRSKFVRRQQQQLYHSLVTPFVSTFWFGLDCVCLRCLCMRWIGPFGRHESNIDGILMKLLASRH